MSGYVDGEIRLHSPQLLSRQPQHRVVAFCLGISLVLLTLVSSSQADEIREIVIAENTKTTDGTVRSVAGIDEGDEWTMDRQEEVRRDLISSGLFKEVDIFSEPHPEGGLRITILAYDKHSWVIAPTYYNQPTNKGGGVGFGESNLFGTRKQLLLYGQIATGDTFFIAGYRDPSIAGSLFKWQLDVFARRERSIEYRPENRFIVRDKDLRGNPIIARVFKTKSLQLGATIGANLSRNLSLDLRGRWGNFSYTEPTLGQDSTENDIDRDLAEGCLERDECVLPKPGLEGKDIGGKLTLQYNNIANFYGIASGDRFQASWDQSLLGLGSDFSYWIAELKWLRARRFLKTGNVMLRSSLALGDDLPFHAELFSGGTSLRGYKNQQFRGDFKFAANLEFSLELFTIKGFAMRGQVFADSSYTAYVNSRDNFESGDRHYLPRFNDYGDGKLSPFRNTVGVGTRFYIRQIVLPLLGLDVGYGLESGGLEVYFAIGLTDV